MVHFDLCSQKICTKCKFFVNKDGFFRPAGGGVTCRVNDRVTRVSYTTYAVRIVPARVPDPKAGFALPEAHTALKTSHRVPAAGYGMLIRSASHADAAQSMPVASITLYLA
jgi:hypothetical protein